MGVCCLGEEGQLIRYLAGCDGVKDVVAGTRLLTMLAFILVEPGLVGLRQLSWRALGDAGEAKALSSQSQMGVL